ncbi:MAG: DUF2934 domain-containing protein [Chthoniobacterales bacterium]
MAKNSKNQENNGTSDGEAAPKAKKRSKPAAKAAAAKTTAKKTPAKNAAKKTPKPQKSKGYQPSDDEIRLRAYFIAERRLQLSLKGDAAHDWLEARRQLLEEAE